MDKLLKNALGYEFTSMALLNQALTHRSLAMAPQASYERLEFLGDRILGYIIADLLFDAFPDEQEGSLSKRHADLVRRETLAEVACQAGLDEHIHMSRGEADAGGRNSQAILSDVCESLIAAIYRDGGIEPARRFIEKYWHERLNVPSAPPEDAKTKLQEWAQGRGFPLPDYKVVGREGPDHAPIFTIRLSVQGRDAVVGVGGSKRAAERVAARLLLDKITAND
tara:strand:- start:47 stop:718 length:672 start_codon:yes stop_codon:yes gene_type:complete